VITIGNEVQDLGTLSGIEVEERRASGPITEVRFPDRMITLVAMPYNEETARAGGRFLESFAPGSFAGLEHRNGRIRVNREHVIGAPVGRVDVWHSDREEALIGELRVSRTPLGDETLELAADGILDASVGFLPMEGGEEWTENRTRRRVTKAWLHHLGLTADGAYEGARVLEVRRATEPPVPDAQQPPVSATPNRDALVAMLMERGQLKGYSPPP
jgi:HK97 family phage prohead protease